MNQRRIFYYCFSSQIPAGGVKQIYRHVDILSRNGFQAWVFHEKDRFRARWFDNRTPLVGPAGLAARFRPDQDVLVLPEDAPPAAAELPGAKVLFNQGLFHGFARMGLSPPRWQPAKDRNLCALFTISEHNRRTLAFAYPHLAIHRLKLGIDSERFAYVPLENKARQIACAVKGTSLPALYQTLIARAAANRGPLRGYRWVFLSGMTERQVAKALARSEQFLFMSYEEGFGLLPLEAMLSGCVVAALSGGPSDEFLPPSSRFAPGDLVGVARHIERTAARSPARTALLSRRTAAQRQRVLHYSLEAEERSVLEAWNTVLADLAAQPARS